MQRAGKTRKLLKQGLLSEWTGHFCVGKVPGSGRAHSSRDWTGFAAHITERFRRQLKFGAAFMRFPQAMRARLQGVLSFQASLRILLEKVFRLVRNSRTGQTSLPPRGRATAHTQTLMLANPETRRTRERGRTAGEAELQSARWSRRNLAVQKLAPEGRYMNFLGLTFHRLDKLVVDSLDRGRPLRTLRLTQFEVESASVIVKRHSRASGPEIPPATCTWTPERVLSSLLSRRERLAQKELDEEFGDPLQPLTDLSSLPRNIGRITEHVITQLDHRMIAWRERMGKA